MRAYNFFVCGTLPIFLLNVGGIAVNNALLLLITPFYF